jgi:hypothetical protein
MKQSTRHPLDGFEQRLLRELRQVVSENPHPARAGRELATPPSRFGRGLRLSLAAGAAAAAAIAVASAVSVGGGGGSKAWAVSSNADGTVTVTVGSFNSPADAEGLQRKLAEAGIRSLVQYLPPGKTCAGGELAPPPGAVTQTNGDPSAPPPAGARGQEYGLSTGGGHGQDAGPVTQSAGVPPSGEHPSGSESLGIRTAADGSVEFTISPAANSDQTLVIRSQGSLPGQTQGPSTGTNVSQVPGIAQPGETGGPRPSPSTINVSQVPGTAQPCKLVDSPAQ